MSKRFKILFGAFVLIICGLCFRIWALQNTLGAEMEAATNLQSTDSIYITAHRGNILDRNMIPLTNRSETRYLILSPFIKDFDQMSGVFAAAGLDADEVRRRLELTGTPLLIEISGSSGLDEALGSLAEPDLAASVEALKRYEANQPAQHVIGYLRGYDGAGAAGLEAFYDDVMGNSGIYVKTVKDAYGRTVEKFGIRLFRDNSGSRYDSVKTTIDYRIQQIVEDVMEEYNLKGAVVAEDVRTGDILAMASKPGYDPEDVAASLDDASDPLFNRAVASYNAGSIFKVIDAAALFENYKWKNQKYQCDGSIKIGDTVIKCYAEQGHGMIGLNEAFMKSCNIYFIKLALDNGVKDVLKLASSFGWGSATGIDGQGIDESEGNLPTVDKYTTSGHAANISIGQGEILVTPLQACDMAATIANGGVKNRINIVDSIVGSDGTVVKNVRVTSSTRVVRRETAVAVQKLMQLVTSKDGTGSLANLDSIGGSAGKTGTAEGPYVDGVQLVHAWFTGYFPQKVPEIAISVFVENGGNGGDISAPVFAEIAKRIHMYLHND